MASNYTPSGAHTVFVVPDYADAADAPEAFKDYSDQLDKALAPIGVVMPFVGSTAPTGWLVCDGQEYDSSVYPRLASLCGTNFGTATAGKFRVPNLKGRLVVGRDSADTDFATIGLTGGQKTVTLTSVNMPSHTHTATTTVTVDSSGAHTHTVSVSGTTASGGSHSHTYEQPLTADTFDRTGSGNGSAVLTGSQTTSTAASHTHGFTGTGTAASAGAHTHTASAATTVNASGQTTPVALQTLNPYMSLTYIIRAA